MGKPKLKVSVSLIVIKQQNISRLVERNVQHNKSIRQQSAGQTDLINMMIAITEQVFS